MNYLGDFAEGATVYIPFNTFSSDDPSASVTITDLADADIMVHKDGGTTQIATDGATVAIDFDGITGNHLITIDTSVHADYATGSDYLVRIEGTTVDGATINAWVGSFSIENRFMRGTDSALLATSAPTNFGDLAITATTGQVTVGTNNDKTGYSLTATTGLGNQTANITGNLSGSVGSVTGSVGSVSGDTKQTADVATLITTVGTAGEGLTNLGGSSNNWNTTTPPTVGAIADQVWLEAIADHSGTAGSTAEALSNATAPTAAAVADAVWDETLSGHLVAGSTGEALNAAGSAGDPWTTTLPGSYTGSQAGKMMNDILTDTAEIGSAGAGLTALATAAALADIDTTAGEIKAKTDFLPSAAAGSDGGLIVLSANGGDLEFTNDVMMNISGNIQGTVTGIAGTLNTLDQLDAAQDSQHATTQGKVDAVDTVVDTINAQVGTAGAGLTDLGGMSTAMKAEINAEVVDTLTTDTYAEPGQGTPAATTSLAAKIGYLYKGWRNKKTQTATTWSLLNDDATTVDQKATVADDGTTASKTEIESGP